MDVRFRTPANFYVSGKSQCGKTFLVHSMIRNMNELFFPVPNKVIYCYSEYQDMFTELQSEIANILFVESFPMLTLEKCKRLQCSGFPCKFTIASVGKIKRTSATFDFDLKFVLLNTLVALLIVDLSLSHSCCFGLLRTSTRSAHCGLVSTSIFLPLFCSTPRVINLLSVSIFVALVCSTPRVSRSASCGLVSTVSSFLAFCWKPQLALLVVQLSLAGI